MKEFDTFTKLPKNVGNLGKIIIATGFEKLPSVINRPIWIRTQNPSIFWHKVINSKIAF